MREECMTCANNVRRGCLLGCRAESSGDDRCEWVQPLPYPEGSPCLDCHFDGRGHCVLFTDGRYPLEGGARCNGWVEVLPPPYPLRRDVLAEAVSYIFIGVVAGYWLAAVLASRAWLGW